MPPRYPKAADRHNQIVVNDRTYFSTRGLEPRIQRVALALALLLDHPQDVRASGRILLHQISRTVCRIVVDHEDLVAEQLTPVSWLRTLFSKSLTSGRPLYTQTRAVISTSSPRVGSGCRRPLPDKVHLYTSKAGVQVGRPGAQGLVWAGKERDEPGGESVSLDSKT